MHPPATSGAQSHATHAFAALILAVHQQHPLCQQHSISSHLTPRDAFRQLLSTGQGWHSTSHQRLHARRLNSPGATPISPLSATTRLLGHEQGRCQRPCAQIAGLLQHLPDARPPEVCRRQCAHVLLPDCAHSIKAAAGGWHLGTASFWGGVLAWWLHDDDAQCASMLSASDVVRHLYRDGTAVSTSCCCNINATIAYVHQTGKCTTALCLYTPMVTVPLCCGLLPVEADAVAAAAAARMAKRILHPWLCCWAQCPLKWHSCHGMAVLCAAVLHWPPSVDADAAGWHRHRLGELGCEPRTLLRPQQLCCVAARWAGPLPSSL